MSNENDCALMIGRYPEGTRLPSATDETKSIAVGGMQICSINMYNNRQYPCCWTKSGAIENCKSYFSRAAEQSVQLTAAGRAENNVVAESGGNSRKPLGF